jgi:hypothetical protein
MSTGALAMSNFAASKLYHTQSSRAGFTSLLSTLSNLPTREIITTNSYVAPLTESLKFKKNCRYLKTTEKHISH